MQFLIAIAGLIALVVAFWWLSTSPTRTTSPVDVFAPKPLGEINTEPERPIGFGYKNSWLAIRTTDADEVLEALSITNAQRSNWSSGLDAAYKGHTFVSPAIDGWVLVVSHEMPELGHPAQADLWSSMMTALSKRFDDVQYFGTHRVSEFHAWSRFRRGVEHRAFAFADYETMINRGTKTDGELELGYDYSMDPSEEDWDAGNVCFPNEEHVMEIASKWSLDPCKLGELELPAGTGWIGNLSPIQNSG